VNPLLRAGWAVAGMLARAVVATGWSGEGKLARTFALRREATARLRRWVATHRDVTRPLLWMHAPSVGEGLMARPVLERLRAAHPDWQVAYTYFSPSAERFAGGLVPAFADVAEVLPFDTRHDADTWLDLLAPTALCFAKLDVWPVLVERAVARGVRVGLVSASVPAGSGRLSPLARAALGDAYAALAAAGAVDTASAERLVTLGVDRAAVQVTGDTRYDQVLARVAAAADAATWRRVLGDERPTVVAGSTWPSDERVLWAAWAEVRRNTPSARLIVAPHEPSAEHLARLESDAAPMGRVRRLGASDVATADVVLVDRVGVLADLYAVAQVAMVGGGFHGAGLHSVVEPAALGVPVVCGPRDAEQRDASLLAGAGGLVRVADAAALTRTLRQWLSREDARREAGARARQVVERERGAADRSAVLVAGLMGGPLVRPGPRPTD
jgi:3-deoxy-D-manno-octulosonic-acid transferase